MSERHFSPNCYYKREERYSSWGTKIYFLIRFCKCRAWLDKSFVLNSKHIQEDDGVEEHHSEYCSYLPKGDSTQTTLVPNCYCQR